MMILEGMFEAWNDVKFAKNVVNKVEFIHGAVGSWQW